MKSCTLRRVYSCMCTYIMYICIASTAVVEAGGIVQAYRVLIYVGVYGVFCLLYALLYFPFSPPPGGGRATIADSHHKLGTLLGSSRGHILPAGQLESGSDSLHIKWTT
jgi:hypothetical protein